MIRIVPGWEVRRSKRALLERKARKKERPKRHKQLAHAYRDNLRDYKDSIPHLFWYNALIILSNGSATRLGSLSAEWEHFNEWKRINSEGERGVIPLDTVLLGVCEKSRLLDIVENFILYTETKDGLEKLAPMNHRYLGVNNSFAAVENLRKNQGRLGVFWHTQGRGNSYSMIYFAQKVQRKLSANWTFLIVTDRIDLDDQIYKNFAGTGAVSEPEEKTRAQDREHLRQMLSSVIGTCPDASKCVVDGDHARGTPGRIPRSSRSHPARVSGTP